ncbi:aminomethyltransferase family protein [Paracoccus aminophilus]|uniref:Glycine cleavage system T protein (Aminomethyltransferase) n=1 Tax=Paracoccus aminophilus JCM 7686 TaxID=1367847 RepID=S5XV55_PARAH|nr:aminomethyltransferase family protein [Paracoccus aminophilus]AGT11404.1 glycine cleavage system T protein (aminomethyltransferase) [Paracoccus aminophilus JCM 7686]
MANSWRISTLADRHLALGSKLEDWNGMPTAWTYDKPMIDDYTAIRTKAGLMDVSGLKKVFVSGPAATQVVERATTRNMAKLMPGRAVYACMMNEAGKFVDDCVIYRFGPNNYMVVHGTGSGMERLQMAGAGKDVSIIFDDNLHDLSLQGPVAVDFLEKHVPGIRNLAYFGHIQTSLFGKPVMISRTGYTGERGYEIFVRGEDAPAVWDRILEEGKEMGIVPAQFGTLDLLRTESYLLFYPGDNSETFPFADEAAGDTLWELGLDFTVSPNHTGFYGAEEHARLKGKERFKIWGLKLDSKEQPENGAPVFADGKEIGVVTQGLASPVNNYTVAIARLPVAFANNGTKVTVKTGGKEVSATTSEMPFYDVDKKIRSAKG